MKVTELILAASNAVAMASIGDREYGWAASFRLVGIQRELLAEHPNSSKHKAAVGEIKRFTKQVKEYLADKLAKACPSS